MEYVVIPSVICFVVPFAIASKLAVFKGTIEIETSLVSKEQEQLLSSSKMLYFGLAAIVFVPVFKSITHLPPYLGMIFSLGLVWLFSEYVLSLIHI